MKKTGKRLLNLFVPGLLCLAMLAGLLSGCGSKNYGPSGGGDLNYDAGIFPGMNATYAEQSSKTDEKPEEKQDTFVENPFIDTAKQNVSTFSADVDTASYALFRKTVNSWVNQKANRQTILSALEKLAPSMRTEEFLNYFRYDANTPGDGELFGTTVGIIPCPWNSKNQLLRLTLQAPATVTAEGNNLVFLIDVSGSMSDSDKLPLLQKAFSYLTEQLTARDRVSIVTYSGKETVVLNGCPGNEKDKILAAVNGLKESGATNGESGLKMEIGRAHV